MKLRNLKIGVRLGAGFGIVLTLLALIIAMVSMTSLRNRDLLINGLGGANAKAELTNAMQRALFESAIAIRNIGLHNEVGQMKKEEERIQAARDRYVDARDKLVRLGLNTDEQEIIADITRLDRQLEQPLRHAIAQALEDGRNAVAASMGAGVGQAVGSADSAAKAIMTQVEPLHRDILARIGKFVELQQATSAGILAGTVSTADRLLVVLLAAGAGALVCGIACAIMLTRGITRPLTEAVAVARRVASGELDSQIVVTRGDEIGQLLQALQDMNASLVQTVGEVRQGTQTIHRASQEIAHGNSDLSARTEMQASNLQATAGSMEELTATVRQNAENAQRANELAASASEVALRGGNVVAQVVDTMGSIKESSRRIVDIISVIDGIAFQTNILALNAAVEAARAGEQGRGFAVVAAEVRNLAQRSAGAAREIKQLIGDSVNKVDAGSELVDEAGKTMTDIVASVRRVTDIMGNITVASQEQSAGIADINHAIVRMDEMTQRNAALVEEAAAAAQSMQDEAQRLASVVAKFKLASVSPAFEVRDPEPAWMSREAGNPAASDRMRLALAG
jgi:methyl-accepting chemotaxis protein